MTAHCLLLSRETGVETPIVRGPEAPGDWHSARREARRAPLLAPRSEAPRLPGSLSLPTVPFPAWSQVPTVSLGLSEALPVPQAPEGG